MLPMLEREAFQCILCSGEFSMVELLIQRRPRMVELLIQRPRIIASECYARTGLVPPLLPWESEDPTPVRAQSFDEWLAKTSQVIRDAQRMKT